MRFGRRCHPQLDSLHAPAGSCLPLDVATGTMRKPSRMLLHQAATICHIRYRKRCASLVPVQNEVKSNPALGRGVRLGCARSLPTAARGGTDCPIAKGDNGVVTV